MKIKTIRILILSAVFLVACGSQPIHYTETEDYPVVKEIEAEAESYTLAKDATIEAEANDYLLRSIMDDTSLLAKIDAVIGAPLHLDADSFIVRLPYGNVIAAGETDWSQPLTVFLRPNHTETGTNLLFEAYELWIDGIVLVEPFSPRDAGHRLSETDTVIVRIYYEGLGWNGDWYGFLYAKTEVCSENWAEDVIGHIREIIGIGIRDIWFEGSTLHIERSPIENYVPWGPAYYRDTLLYLTAASLPNVEYVTLSVIPAGPHFWAWEYTDEEFDFTANRTRRVREGHRWAWVGPGAE